MKAEIGIVGNSGCEVSLKQRGQKLVIEKSSCDLAYIPRLKQQIELQRSFQQITANQILVPEILEQHESAKSYSVIMEYLPFQDFTEFYGQCSAPSLRQSADLLIDFIRSNLMPTKLEANASILSKLADISTKMDSAALATTFRQMIERLTTRLQSDRIILPGGRCHGDLTLSNMLFSTAGNSIGLIDFLDSYIESPVIDLVKVRQDTHLGWSFVKTDKSFSRARLHQALAYLDKRFSEEIERHIDQKTYNMLQSVNILRILPYAQDRKTLEFIHSALLKLEV